MSSEKFVKQIKQQSILSRNQLIIEAVKRGKSISRNGDLVNSIQNNMTVAKKQGVPFKVRFSFLVRGTYIAAGVGRGTTIAQALANQSNRDKVDWYKPVIAAQIPTYSALWNEYWAEKLIEELTPELNKI